MLAPSNASNAVGCKPELNHFDRLLFFSPPRVVALSLRWSSRCQEGGDQKQNPGHRKDGPRLLGAQVRHISAIVWLHFTAGIIFRSKAIGCYGEVHTRSLLIMILLIIVQFIPALNHPAAAVV